MTVHEGKTRLYDAWNLFIHFSMALVSTYVSYCWSLIIESDPWDDDVVMMTQWRDRVMDIQCRWFPKPMRWWCRHDDTTTRQSHGHSMPMISKKDIYKQTHIKLCLIDCDKFADKALVKPGNMVICRQFCGHFARAPPEALQASQTHFIGACSRATHWRWYWITL